jgi:hypothetical protein
MRVARVLHTSCPAPIIALERDGCLYDVAELERLFGTPFAPDRLAGASDFHTRVISLACAGLHELDERLRSGDRPTEARLWPSDFLWLPPCDTERSLYVQLERASAHGSTVEPRYHVGNARGLVGHETTVPFPAREESPDVEVCIAALIGEELKSATPLEAERAICGYAILLAWVAREEERRGGASRGRDFGATLGPVLVTKEEAGAALGRLPRARAGGVAVDLHAPDAAGLTTPEMIAFVSRYVTLAPGDVIGGAPYGRSSLVAYGVPLEVSIDRLGKLAGRPARGPEPPPFRRMTPAR